MPHVSISMYAGRSEAEKLELAARITDAVKDVLRHGDDAVSVSIRDVAPAEWMDTVYRAEIAAHPDRLYKRPGYGPLK